MSKARGLANLGNAYSDGALSNRNILINNDFRIWQRGTVFYGGSNSWSYTTDRWQAGWTAITEKITGGLKMTIGSSTVGNQLFQIIENIDNAFQRNFDTYTATIKFKAPVGVTVELYVKNWGNGWSDLFSGSVAATGNEQTFTISGPSSGLVSGGNSYFNMIFNGATTGQVIEVYDTQLEGGSQATPFEHRSFGDELARCQRYYSVIGGGSYVGIDVGQQFSTNGSIHGIQYPTPMRAAPSISFDNLIVTDRTIFDNPVDGFSVTTAGTSSAYIRTGWTTAVGSAGNAVLLAIRNGYAGGIKFDAEL